MDFPGRRETRDIRGAVDDDDDDDDVDDDGDEDDFAARVVAESVAKVVAIGKFLMQV